MTSHSDTSSAMRVAAKVEVLTGDSSFAVEPSVTSQTGPTGEPILVEKPAEFTVGGDKYSMAIDRILADQGAVVLRIPELAGNNEPEQLVMEISRIPLINLVWLGTTLILLGTLLVFFRRRSELYQKAENDARMDQKDTGQPVRRG
jgi:cytochrome c-type biogenesis protein CcmF